MITKIAKKINEKHGDRVLVELELNDKEVQQRTRAMAATFEILGQSNDPYINLDDRRTAFVFAVSYTVALALVRIFGR